MLSEEAEKLILSGNAPSGMKVTGFIELKDNHKLKELPSNLSADVLSLKNCSQLTSLPFGMRVRRLILDGCTALQTLPPDLQCDALQWHNYPMAAWPDGVSVKRFLDLTNSPALETLPAGLKVGTLRLTDCTSLKALPEGIDVYFLEMRGCSDLARWPERGSVRFGRLNARDCTGLTYLPDWLNHVGQLNLMGCARIERLPDRLEVTSWIEIGGTAIRSLPETIDESCLRWRGVPIEKRIVFDRESITAEEILTESNVERRRVLLEMMGYDHFLHAAGAVTLDQDRDRGGERKLLKVPMPDDEDLVCVSVICPSTQHQYIIRVPPNMTNCRKAVAWIAGFDREEDYAPIAET